MIMNDTRKTVLDLTSIALFGNDISIPENTDWNSVFNEVKNQNIVSLLYPVIENRNIPDNILSNWKKLRDQYLLNNARNITCHISIHQLMNKANIPYVILKGVASGVYYPNYLLRGYGDVDFLVNKDNFQKTSDTLITNNYIYIEDSKKHRVFKKDNLIYELHDHVFKNADNKLNDILDEFFSDILDKAVPFKHNDSICMIPSDRHNAVILLLHTAQHIAESGIGLRHLLDWAVFVNNMGHTFFQDIKPTLKKMGIWRLCCILTALCTKYIGLKEFEWAKDIDDKYLEDLMNDIFKSGEFGNIYKNNTNRNHTESLNNYKSDDVAKSLFVIINKKAKKLPIIKKIPILLPVGWLYISGRYLVNTISGKRTLKGAKDIIERSAEKKQILQEWHLFENEE